MALYKKFVNKLGLFVYGWDLLCSKRPVPYEQQQKIFQKGRLIVDGNP